MKLKLKIKKPINRKIYIFGALTVFVLIIFMVGTFLDFQIAKNIYQPSSSYGKMFDYFGQIAFLIPVNFLAISLLNYLKTNKKTWEVGLNITNIIYYTIIIFGPIIYLCKSLLKDSTTINIILVILNIFILLAFIVATSYYIAQKPAWLYDDPKILWKILLAAAFIIIFSLSTEILKNLFSRPRPNSVFEQINQYRPWWKISYAQGFGKNKSFPSGHTTSAFTIIALLLLFKTCSKEFYITLFVGFLSAALVGSSRMVLAKHFLTDITFACLTGIGWLMVGYLIVNKKIDIYIEGSEKYNA